MMYVTKQEGNRMKKQNELISVIMAVYNGEEYLKPAIQSVLDQTYKNFEFIIVNDASTDNTVNIIESFRDERICLVHNEKNLRLAASLNKAIAMAKGKYLLRMDADDICFPDRFEKQVAYMDKHPEIGIAFGSVLKFSGDTVLKEIDSNEKKPEYIRATMLFFNTVYHPNVIMRREVCQEYKYREEYTVAEDMDLWLRAGEKYRIANMNKHTLLYRIHSKQVTTSCSDKQRQQEILMKKFFLERLLGTVSEEEENLHSRISYRRDVVEKEELLAWLGKLYHANKKQKQYDEKIFENVLVRVGILVSIYNHYFIKGIADLAKVFGIGAVGQGLYRMARNVFADVIRVGLVTAKGKQICGS